MELFIVRDSSECKFLVRTLCVRAGGHFIRALAFAVENSEQKYSYAC